MAIFGDEDPKTHFLPAEEDEEKESNVITVDAEVILGLIQDLLTKAAQEVPEVRAEFEAASGKLKEALALILRAKRKVETLEAAK